MKNSILHDNFVAAIKARVQTNAKLVNILMDILYIEKEAVYRRLRGEVPFTFAEIATISTSLGISLDTLIGTTFNETTPFHYRHLEFTNPEDLDITPLINYADLLDKLNKNNYSELADCSNVLPQMLYFNYEHIRKFYVFKTRYQHKGPKNIKKFSEIELPEKLITTCNECVDRCQNITETAYIWDHCIIHHLVNDIKYFAELGLITAEEIQDLKKELFCFIDDINTLAAKGRFPRTGNRILFYVSNINFETGYCYLNTPEVKMSMVKAFALNSVISTDERVFENMKNWINSMKRLSTMISVSGEMHRILFIKEQKRLLVRFNGYYLRDSYHYIFR